MPNEFTDAVTLASRVLDRPNADPDDDLAMLARQFLRCVERGGGTVPDFKPGECADCGMRVESDAEAFLHAAVHSEPNNGLGRNSGNLHTLPYIFWPRIARLLDEYKRSV